MSYQTSGKSPVYQTWKRGYQDRLRNEAAPDICVNIFNCGKYLKVPTYHNGIMVQERNNKLQNILDLCKSSHHMNTALLEIDIAKAILNYLNFQMHEKQYELPAYKRRYPQYAPHKHGPYLPIFEQLKSIYIHLLSLELFKKQFHQQKQISDNKYIWTLLPNTDIVSIVPKIIVDKIIANNLLMNKENQWTQKHTYGVRALVEEFKIKTLNDTNIEFVINKLRQCQINKKLLKKNLIAAKIKDAIKKNNR